MTLSPQETLFNPQTLECPYSYYDKLRREAPVYRMPDTGFYIVTRYDLVMEAARNFKVFSNSVDQQAERPGGRNKEIEQLYREQGWMPVPTMIQCDPPRQTRYRSLVDRAFTATRVRKMEAYIETIVQELIDGFIDRGEIEFMKDFAVRLPLMVIADQLGVPREDLAKFKEWSDASVEPIGLMITPDREVECARKIIEFQHYFAAKCEEKRKAPSDDIITTLVQAEIEDEHGVKRPLDTGELLSIIQQLLIAGNETTTNALGAGMVLLIENPDQARAVREDPLKLKTFVEECLRLESPVAGLFRMTTQDTELGGVKLPKGSVVILRWAAANRDEGVFENAGALDVCRKNAGAQVAFGVGAHFCVGAMLARQELLQAFRALTDQLDHIAIKPGHSLSHHPSVILRGLKDLPITFKARTRAAAE